MSDLSATVQNFESMLQGKTDFNGFMAGEGKLIAENIASCDAAVQPALTVAFDAFKAGASSLVGAGLTALGPILAESTDTQTTQVLNILNAIGVPTNGVLSLAEHAALTTIINGLKAGLDKIGIQIATNGSVSVSKAQSAPLPPIGSVS